MFFPYKLYSVELEKGEDNVQHAMEAFNLPKAKKLIKLLKMMANEEDMLVITPIKIL